MKLFAVVLAAIVAVNAETWTTSWSPSTTRSIQWSTMTSSQSTPAPSLLQSSPDDELLHPTDAILKESFIKTQNRMLNRWEDYRKEKEAQIEKIKKDMETAASNMDLELVKFAIENLKSNFEMTDRMTGWDMQDLENTLKAFSAPKGPKDE